MKLALFTLVLIALGPAGSAHAEGAFACNMKALTKGERATHQKVSRALFEAIEERQELANGFAFRLPPATLTKTAQWVSLERKCCPFFNFELDLEKDDGPLWLRVTGSEGIKPFILAEFGLEEPKGR